MFNFREVFMKNLRMLFVIAAMSVFGIANGLDLREYSTGSLQDKEGRTMLHLAAESCDNVDRFAAQIVFSALELVLTEPNFERSKEKPSIFTKDNNGETALDIAKRMYAKTKDGNCAKMILEFMEQEEADEKAKE